MSRGFAFIAPFLLLVPFAQAADLPDPCGIWKLKCTSPDGKARECLVEVCRDGNTLKATYIADGVKRPVKGIAFEDGALVVQVDGQFAGKSYDLTYKGKPSKDSFCGKARWSYGWASGSFPFEGERLAAADRPAAER